MNKGIWIALLDDDLILQIETTRYYWKKGKNGVFDNIGWQCGTPICLWELAETEIRDEKLIFRSNKTKPEKNKSQQEGKRSPQWKL